MNPSAAIYLRVSSDSQTGADKYGLAVQENACREYAKRAGFDVKTVYHDIVTGTSSKRAAFSRLLLEISVYDAVVVFSVDRLARTVPVAYALAQELADAGVELHSSTEGRLSFDDDGQATAFGLHALLADAERRRIVRRLTEGKLQKIRGGQTLAPLRCYGYKNGEIYEPQAQWVRWMYRQALEVGMHEITNELARLGVTTSTGKSGWDRDALRKLLRNSVYRGEYVYGRDRVTRRPRGDAITCPVPRIVDDELWYAVQRAMDYRSTGAGRRGSRTDLYPLTGRIRCAECGGAMVGKKSNYHRVDGGVNAHYFYGCGDRALAVHTRKGCSHQTFYRTRVLHEAIWTALRELGREPQTLAGVVATPAPVPMDTGAAVQDIDQQLAKARNAYLRGIDTEDEYAETKAMLTAQRSRLLALADQGVPQVVADDGRVRLALEEALREDDLHRVAVRLGLMVRVGAGGVIRLTLDPA